MQGFQRILLLFMAFRRDEFMMSNALIAALDESMSSIVFIAR